MSLGTLSVKLENITIEVFNLPHNTQRVADEPQSIVGEVSKKEALHSRESKEGSLQASASLFPSFRAARMLPVGFRRTAPVRHARGAGSARYPARLVQGFFQTH